MKPKEPTKDISELMEMIKKRQEVLTFQCAVFLKSECNLNGDVAERAKKLIILMEKQNEEESKEIEQAARNLWNNAEQAGFQRGIKTFIRSHGNETAEQKTASAIFKDIETKCSREKTLGWLIDAGFSTYNELKKKHLGE